jgi:hypothetical protein
MSRGLLFSTVLGIGVLLTLGLTGALGPQGAKRLSRPEAVIVALPGKQPERVEVKMVTRDDLRSVVKDGLQAGGDQAWSGLELAWVVAVSGDFGPPCVSCSGPSTWGVAVVTDRAPGKLVVFIRGTTGYWPPFFDDLPDVDAGSGRG